MPVDGVDFLAARVADDERGVIGGKSRPLSKISPEAVNVMEAHESLDRRIRRRWLADVTDRCNPEKHCTVEAGSPARRTVLAGLKAGCVNDCGGHES